MQLRSNRLLSSDAISSSSLFVHNVMLFWIIETIDPECEWKWGRILYFAWITLCLTHACYLLHRECAIQSIHLQDYTRIQITAD